MTDKPQHVYVIQGRGQRDYAGCQVALARVPAAMTALPFIGTAGDLIAKTRDADGLVTSASPVTRAVMSALEGLKVVARTHSSLIRCGGSALGDPRRPHSGFGPTTSQR
jgi:hypothetical protein